MTICNPLALEVDPFELTSPPQIDIERIREHVAVDDDEFDTLLLANLSAAVSWAEGQMHRTIYQRSHVWILKGFPEYPGRIRLPRGRTVSVEGIDYYAAGLLVEMAGPSSSPSGSDWREDLRASSGGFVSPAHGASWPLTDVDAPAPVTIRFTAGYATGAVPAGIEHALLFAISDMFEMRGTADLASGGSTLATREALISPFKLPRWY
jgi:hypothetical protein